MLPQLWPLSLNVGVDTVGQIKKKPKLPLAKPLALVTSKCLEQRKNSTSMYDTSPSALWSAMAMIMVDGFSVMSLINLLFNAYQLLAPTASSSFMFYESPTP